MRDFPLYCLWIMKNKPTMHKQMHIIHNTHMNVCIFAALHNTAPWMLLHHHHHHHHITKIRFILTCFNNLWCEWVKIVCYVAFVRFQLSFAFSGFYHANKNKYKQKKDIFYIIIFNFFYYHIILHRLHPCTQNSMNKCEWNVWVHVKQFDWVAVIHLDSIAY